MNKLLQLKVGNQKTVLQDYIHHVNITDTKEIELEAIEIFKNKYGM